MMYKLHAVSHCTDGIQYS